jgi:hypothetical protein
MTKTNRIGPRFDQRIVVFLEFDVAALRTEPAGKSGNKILAWLKDQADDKHESSPKRGPSLNRGPLAAL